jgi:hypothetical protein
MSSVESVVKVSQVITKERLFSVQVLIAEEVLLSGEAMAVEMMSIR